MLGFRWGAHRAGSPLPHPAGSLASPPWPVGSEATGRGSRGLKGLVLGIPKPRRPQQLPRRVPEGIRRPVSGPLLRGQKAFCASCSLSKNSHVNMCVQVPFSHAQGREDYIWRPHSAHESTHTPTYTHTHIYSHTHIHTYTPASLAGTEAPCSGLSPFLPKWKPQAPSFSHLSRPEGKPSVTLPHLPHPEKWSDLTQFPPLHFINEEIKAQRGTGMHPRSYMARLRTQASGRSAPCPPCPAPAPSWPSILTPSQCRGLPQQQGSGPKPVSQGPWDGEPSACTIFSPANRRPQTHPTPNHIPSQLLQRPWGISTVVLGQEKHDKFWSPPLRAWRPSVGSHLGWQAWPGPLRDESRETRN